MINNPTTIINNNDTMANLCQYWKQEMRPLLLGISKDTSISPKIAMQLKDVIANLDKSCEQQH